MRLPDANDVTVAVGAEVVDELVVLVEIFVLGFVDVLELAFDDVVVGFSFVVVAEGLCLVDVVVLGFGGGAGLGSSSSSTP